MLYGHLCFSSWRSSRWSFFGFGGLAASAVQTLRRSSSFVFLVLFVLSLLFGLVRGSA